MWLQNCKCKITKNLHYEEKISKFHDEKLQVWNFWRNLTKRNSNSTSNDAKETRFYCLAQKRGDVPPLHASVAVLPKTPVKNMLQKTLTGNEHH